MSSQFRASIASVLLRNTAGSFATLGVALVATMLVAPAAVAKTNLPKPFVSRSLDATLMPITPQVRNAFRLSAKETGVLIVSTDPRGVAAKSGIRAGDVISSVRGKKIANPAHLDATVLYWLKQNVTDFRFNGWRSGKDYSVGASITKALFDTAIDLATIGLWLSVPKNSYFSYDVYYEEYADIIVEEYSVYVEEVAELSEDATFTEEVSEEYEAYSEESTEESSEDVSDEENSESDESEDSTDDDSQDDGDEDSGDESEDSTDDDSQDDGDEDSGDEPEVSLTMTARTTETRIAATLAEMTATTIEAI